MLNTNAETPPSNNRSIVSSPSPSKQSQFTQTEISDLFNFFFCFLEVVREHYFRDDIHYGAPSCKIENSIIDNVVVLSVVLEEVRNKNQSVYNRLRAFCSNLLRNFFVFSNEYHMDTYMKTMNNESPNDRNDRGVQRSGGNPMVSKLFGQ